MSTTISDFRASQREQAREDRRQADETKLKLAELQKEAEKEKREQDRLDEIAEREQERKDKEKADKVAAAQATKARAEKEAARQRRRERRARAVKAAPAWLAEHLDLAGALVVMACSILPALIAQAAKLGGTPLAHEGWWGPVLVLLLPVMLECSAWAATAAEAKAVKEGRNPWPYRIAIYTFAGLAAAVNYDHGHEVGGLMLGVVLAASSIIPVTLWQLIQLGRHREIRAKHRLARADRKAAQQVRKERQRLYPDVWHLATQLRAIAGRSLSEDDAFQAAYGVIEGTGVELDRELLMLLSAEQLDLMAQSEERLGEVLTRLHTARTRRAAASAKLAADPGQNESTNPSADGSSTPSTQTLSASTTGLLDAFGKPLVRSQSSQITPSVPPSTRARKTVPAPARETRPKAPKRALSNGARKAARETAKQAAKDAARDERAAMTDWVRGRLAKGDDVPWQDVRDEAHRRRRETNKKATAPSRAWCYTIITAAKEPRPRLAA